MNKLHRNGPAAQLLHVLRDTMIAGVRSDSPDLSARQFAVLLSVYLEDEEQQTVRGLAATLNVSKPAITRALDRLGELRFIQREVDRRDRRSIIVARTPAGWSYLNTTAGFLEQASKQIAKRMK